jgi:hypothetical protein
MRPLETGDDEMAPSVQAGHVEQGDLGMSPILCRNETLGIEMPIAPKLGTAVRDR